MATTFVNIGSSPNDGTGDVIRTAFDTINNNFDLINGAVFAGTQSSIISAVSVDTGYLISNSYILATTYVNADSLVGNTVTSNGNLYVSQDGAYIIGNVTIIGNLSVTGTQAASQSQQSSSPILQLHYSATPLVVDDGKDIGLQWQYYDDTLAEKKAFLGWQNTTGSLVYFDDVTETANIITAGTPGNVQIGSLLISNTTSSTSNITGALLVNGGAGIGGNLYVRSNIFIGNDASLSNLTVRGFHVGNMYFSGSDTIFINGSPVQTAATAFNGGTVALPTLFSATTAATSTTTGAVRVTGGLGVAGNIWAGNIYLPATGTLNANVRGNIFTAAQPFITSLGTLVGLNVSGILNTANISPNLNQTYSLGTASNNRWLKIWTYDIDSSGTIQAAMVNSTGGTHSGPVEFTSNVQAINTTSGAVKITGGLSVNTGNLYIGGSAGTAIVHVGNIIPGGNSTFNLGTSTSWYNTFYGVSVQAQYADLAEKYISDADYNAGTVVVFGGEKEITTTTIFADHRVAGVISTNPAYIMNAVSNGLPVALRGRVPVQVIGPVEKGDLLVTACTPGYAVSVGGDTAHGIKIFAKSLESNTDVGPKIIEAVIL